MKTRPSQTRAQNWLLSVIARTGLRPTPLAKKAGLSPSTLHRALDQDKPVELDTRTIQKIVDTFGIPGPFESQTTDNLDTALRPELEAVDTNLWRLPVAEKQYLRRVQTRSIELCGYLPLDLVCFDPDAVAHAGDIVEAASFNFETGSPDAVFRLYEPPYLVTRSMSSAVSTKPLLLDNQQVKIVAIAIAMLRKRP